MSNFKVFLVLGALIIAVGCASKAKKMEGEKSADTKTEAAAKAKDSKSSTAAMGESTGTSKCTLPNDERIISVSKVGQGCAVLYTKFGDEKEVATGSWGTEHCDEVKGNIVKNLGAAGFNCN